MSTITAEQQEAISARLEGMTLPVGLGSEESACSIAAINLALTGKLTDKIPHCMSQVIGKWIILIQDSMPSEMRNSARWKSLLPRAAGTGREMEQERLDLVMAWMWDRVLPTMQSVAEEGGYGKKWLAMTTRRNDAAARVAAAAADAARETYAEGSRAARAAANAAWWAVDAAQSAADVEVAAWRPARSAAGAAVEVLAAREAMAGWPVDAVDTDAWTTFDPCDLLDRLIRVGEQSPAT